MAKRQRQNAPGSRQAARDERRPRPTNLSEVRWDNPAASREFVRVVRPGGVIGLLWNVRDDRVPWMGRMSDIVDGEDSMRASRTDALAEIREVHPDVEQRDFSHVVVMTPEDMEDGS